MYPVDSQLMSVLFAFSNGADVSVAKMIDALRDTGRNDLGDHLTTWFR